jgi:hypothetical protein
MDAGIKILESLYGKLTVREKVNFIKIPLIILWICAPLSLYGYIVTKNILLYFTFIGLFILNILFSLLAYKYISRNNLEELKSTFKKLNETITHLKNELINLFSKIIKK